MKLITAKWTPKVNMLLILCDCGGWIEHRADRWTVVCPECRHNANLGPLREEYARRKRGLG